MCWRPHCTEGSWLVPHCSLSSDETAGCQNPRSVDVKSKPAHHPARCAEVPHSISSRWEVVKWPLNSDSEVQCVRNTDKCWRFGTVAWVGCPSQCISVRRVWRATQKSACDCRVALCSHPQWGCYTKKVMSYTLLVHCHILAGVVANNLGHDHAYK